MSEGTDNITLLPQVEHDKFRAALDVMRRNLSLSIEYHQLTAKIRKAAFDAYIEQGFTPEQALQLCVK